MIVETSSAGERDQRDRQVEEVPDAEARNFHEGEGGKDRRVERNRAENEQPSMDYRSWHLPHDRRRRAIVRPSFE
jgi:hypothetical protein